MGGLAVDRIKLFRGNDGDDAVNPNPDPNHPSRPYTNHDATPHLAHNKLLYLPGGVVMFAMVDAENTVGDEYMYLIHVDLDEMYHNDNLWYVVLAGSSSSIQQSPTTVDAHQKYKDAASPLFVVKKKQFIDSEKRFF